MTCTCLEGIEYYDEPLNAVGQTKNKNKMNKKVLSICSNLTTKN